MVVAFTLFVAVAAALTVVGLIVYWTIRQVCGVRYARVDVDPDEKEHQSVEEEGDIEVGRVIPNTSKELLTNAEHRKVYSTHRDGSFAASQSYIRREEERKKLSMAHLDRQDVVCRPYSRREEETGDEENRPNLYVAHRHGLRKVSSNRRTDFRDVGLQQTISECRNTKQKLKKVSDPDVARKLKIKHIRKDQILEEGSGPLKVSPRQLADIRSNLRAVDVSGSN